MDIQTRQFWNMGIADQIRKEHGIPGDGSEEFDKIIADIRAIADKCKSYIYHEKMSHKTMSKLKKEGFSVGFENNQYIITW